MPHARGMNVIELDFLGILAFFVASPDFLRLVQGTDVSGDTGMDFRLHVGTPGPLFVPFSPMLLLLRVVQSG